MELFDKYTYTQRTIINNIPWVDKYRPISLDEVVAHTEIIKILDRFITNNCMTHLLFYGPSGTGKTSVIMACARKLYGDSLKFMTLELNSSDERGIEIVRHRIKQFVTGKTVFCQEKSNKYIHKLVILDEIDAMTDDAQATLRQIIERHSENARFCLICNNISKINPALQSRCTIFRFTPLSKTQMEKKLNEIVQKENVKISKKGIDTIIERSNGDMRKALNILQSTFMAFDEITSNNVNICIGYPLEKDISAIINILLKNTFEKSYNKIMKIKSESGLSLAEIIDEIYKFIIETNMPQHNKMNIISELANIEYNQSTVTNEYIQVSALISIFQLYGKYKKHN